MKKINLKSLALITVLTLSLTGCENKEETKEKESTNLQYETQITNPQTEDTQEKNNESENSSNETNSYSEQTSENFTFFKTAKEEIITYIESEEFEKLKSQGKYYITTGIDFIFFDEPIEGVYFKDLKEELKEDVIRDLNSLDVAIMEYFPDYKESFNSKYQIASDFINEKYLSVMDSIKEYLGEENYNAVGEIKDQIKEDVSTKTEEIVEDAKGLYKEWKNK